MKFLYLTLIILTSSIYGLTINDDIDAGWIQRYPVMNYVWDSSQPKVDGWPTNNQTVTWTANIKNWMEEDVTVPYKWTLDGVLVEEGTITLTNRHYTTVKYETLWKFEREELIFTIDPLNDIEEYSELNNSISIYTDAISVGLWVEQSMYDYFHTNQGKLGIGSNSWEDWAQRHVDRWNQFFRNAVYGSDTPHGVIDRIRIDKIVIVADNALPLNGGLATNNPDRNDRTIDLEWGFPYKIIGMYSDNTRVSDDNPFYFEQSLMHELGHARYLIDTYGFNLHDRQAPNTPITSNIMIRVDGKLVAGTKYIPNKPPWYDCVYSPTAFGDLGYGLMASPKTLVDHYSAMALNLISGHRAIKGNYNSPGNIGVFKQDLPEQNKLQIMDAYGHILSNANVYIYQAQRGSGWYAKKYIDTPNLTLTSDERGLVNLGRCPFSPDGLITHTYGLANGVAIIKVEQQGKIGFGFIDIMQFNMNYWRGQIARAYYNLKVNMIGNQFGIAGIKPRDQYTTPLYSVDVSAVIDGTNNATAVKVNGQSMSYAYGQWNKKINLVAGTNLITVIAINSAGTIVTQKLAYIRKDITPPEIGKAALKFPFPGAELNVSNPVQILWTKERITDIADINNVSLKMAIVDSKTLEEVKVYDTLCNNNGLRNWIPSAELSSTTKKYFFKFKAIDQAGNTTNLVFNRNEFSVIPEPASGALIGLSLIIMMLRK